MSDYPLAYQYNSQVTVTVTLQCSGTRRREQIDEYPGDGDECEHDCRAEVVATDSIILVINAPWGEAAM